MLILKRNVIKSHFFIKNYIFVSLLFTDSLNSVINSCVKKYYEKIINDGFSRTLAWSWQFVEFDESNETFFKINK